MERYIGNTASTVEISMNESVLLLVCSCDKFSDTWEICYKSLRNNWPDCPYKVSLLTESKSGQDTCSFENVINVKSTNWSEMLHEALESISCKYIVFILEDQWPVYQVNQSAIDKAKMTMDNDESIAAVYFESSKPNGIKHIKNLDDDFNEIPFGAPYRLSCAPGFFRKEYLLKMTSEKISPWDFERIKSFDEVGRDVRILEVKNTNWHRIDPTGAIFRGKWVPGVRKYAEGMGIALDFGARPEMSWLDVFKRKTKDFVFNINPELVVKIQNMIAKR